MYFCSNLEFWSKSKYLRSQNFLLFAEVLVEPGCKEKISEFIKGMKKKLLYLGY